MKVIEVVVTAARMIPHPLEKYASLRPAVTVRAQVEDDEDWHEVTRKLQAEAEELLEDHRHVLSINEIRRASLENRQKILEPLGQAITASQTKLKTAREAQDE